MSDAVTIIQVVAPTTVALAAIIYAARRQERGFDHDRHLADRAELRELLDEATAALTSSAGRGNAIQRELLTHGENIAVAAAPLVEEFKKQGRAVDLNHDRLSIRVGPEAPVVRAHQTARDATRNIADAVALLSGLGAQDLKDSWEAIRDGTADIEAARDAFVRQAVALVGVEPERAPRVRLVRGRREA